MWIEEAARNRPWPGLDERLRAFAGNAAVKKFTAILLAAALLGTASYWYNRSAPAPKASAIAVVRRTDFSVKITELGELRALDSVTVSGQVDVPIIYLIPEGTEVKRGDVLVRFDPSKYEVALDESKAGVQVAQAELRKAQKDVEAQRHKLLAEIARFEAEGALAQLELDDLKRKPLVDELERARMDLEKAKATFKNSEKNRSVLPELVEKGFITKNTLEEAELKYLEAKANLLSAQFNFEKVTAGATPQELERAKIRLEQAKSSLEKAQHGMVSQVQSFEAGVEREKANVERAKNLIEKASVRFKRTELRAPRDGLVVYARAGAEKSSEKVQVGMVPFDGQALLYLPDLSTMVADTEVNEIDIGKVRLGGPVDVRMEAYPGAIFHGKVLKIGSLARLKQSRSGTPSGIKIFDVTVQVEDKDPRLRPGLTVNLDIIADRQQNVIAIPLSAVASRRGEYFVFVHNAGKLEERKVVLGQSNDQSVIVQEGLHPGEQVILNPPPSDSL